MTQGEIINMSKGLLVKGTIYADNILNKGSMKISPVFENESGGKYFHLVNYNYIRDFRIHYIEEIIDE